MARDYDTPQPVVCDPFSGLVVRYTDNRLKDGDLPGINQEPIPLELDDHGLPVGWEVEHGERR